MSRSRPLDRRLVCVGSGHQNYLIAFRKGLAELGYSEGRNIVIEYRAGKGQFDRLPALAADLVQRAPALIVTTGIGSALGATAASARLPWFFRWRRPGEIRFGRQP